MIPHIAQLLKSSAQRYQAASALLGRQLPLCDCCKERPTCALGREIYRQRLGEIIQSFEQDKAA
ncbi:hypothetical protein [Coleofasciculus sp. FACHB-T130]|uniref:hypothetical protein n=1 Tax=Cyanophyceae TaxID=3028117 RepID=UPI0016853A97|nr:hypothetical protein [Coleofasciculus sp. FACHB-T130]MBD1878364.1 hypothetical protein [Coleofasciculus sp. FACHB-T130]